MSLNAIYSVGANALMNAQTGLSVTGNNIANADVTGYSRRVVSYVTSNSLDANGLTVGSGAEVEEIARQYNYFVERQYLSANSNAMYWYAKSESLYTVESLFNESDDYSIATALDTLFTTASSLAGDADSEALRTELTDYADVLASQLRGMNTSLEQQITELNAEISDQVDEANELMNTIASLNRAIVGNPDDNALQDERDKAIRGLSSLVDIQTISQEDGSITVLMGEGQPLVDGGVSYALRLEGGQTFSALTTGSTYDGQLYYEGNGSQEFTVEFVTSGPTDGSASAATFRVSTDGGKTWLTDDNGNEQTFIAGDYDSAVEIEGVSLWFGAANDADTAAAGTAQVEDSFTVVPKSGVYWYSNTSGKVNVTPLGDGSDSGDKRISGGSLGALLATRDSNVKTYQEELDAIAAELIWQVNYQHSQGAGLTRYETAFSAANVGSSTVPLSESGLPYAERITSGNLSFAVYDKETGDPLGVSALDFSSINPPGISTFDPAQHSLADVSTAINDTFSGLLTASVSNGSLRIEAGDGYQFEFAGDTTGVLAATGMNTFFSGSGVDDIAVDSRIAADPDRVNCAMVDGTGTVAEGDSSVIQNIADIAETSLTVGSIHGSTSQTLGEHLSGVAADAGLAADTAARNYLTANTLAEDLDTRQQSVSGVNMDEELTSLTRYQQAYQAASQLIQTANEMFDTLLSMAS